MIQLVTVMICIAKGGEFVPVEVPGAPVVTRTEYIFPEFGIRFSRKQCFVDHTEDSKDVVQ
jgi:hypothetical protein